MNGKFIKIRCKDCENEQVVFDKACTPVYCHICGSKLTKSTGGKAIIYGEFVEEAK